MARRDKPVSDGALRDYLLRLELGTVTVLLGGDWNPALSGKGSLIDQLHARDQAPLPELTPEQLQSPHMLTARVLATGEAHQCRRGDLPDWHHERFAGDLNDEFVLGADDVLRRR